MKTKLALCVALVLTFGLGSGWAQDPASPSSPKTTALAEELLTLFQLDKTMDGAFQRVMKMQEQMATSKGGTPEAQARQKAVMHATMEETRKSFSWDVIKSTFVQIYAEVFTADELQGMIDFFKSPVGRKWIEKQPQLQAATMEKMQGIMMQVQPKIQEAIKKATEESTKTTTP